MAISISFVRGVGAGWCFDSRSLDHTFIDQLASKNSDSFRMIKE
ncbi:hypothetical protein [uncultured Microbacterium sp.]|nr:hypothetical protein [uncultured Microbacterium sp.]